MLPPFLEFLTTYFWLLPVTLGLYLLFVHGTRVLGAGLLLANTWTFYIFLSKQGFVEGYPGDENRSLLVMAALTGEALVLVGIFFLLVGRVSGYGAKAGAGGTSVAHTTDMRSLFTPRNASNTITRAAEARDAAMMILKNAADERSMRHVLQKSELHHEGIWGRMDFVNHPDPADPALSLRTVVELFVERFDFHRMELLYTVRVTVGAKTVEHTGLRNFTALTANRVLTYLQTPGQRLRLPDKIRMLPWQLWRPKNKVQRIRPDWMGKFLSTLCVLLLIVPPVGTLLGVLGLVALGYRQRRRPVHTLTTGKPFSDPRILNWMDSWQVTVRDLGTAMTATATGITDRIKKDAPSDLLVTLERLGYWSTDGRVERDQYVVRYRRALGYIQVSPYGGNLYVSWECHLNLGAWAEEAVAEGVDRQTGLNVVANRTTFGRQGINEYDVADANFLTEWMHAAVKAELKVQIAEHHIDQEIDFTINRESRKEALGASGGRQNSPADGEGSTKKKKLFSRVG